MHLNTIPAGEHVDPWQNPLPAGARQGMWRRLAIRGPRSGGLLTVAMLGLGCLIARAGDDSAYAGPNDLRHLLPTAVDPEDFQELLSHSPFTRSLNLPGSIALTGIAHVDGKPMVTVRETATGKTHVISETPNAQGWRLVEVATDASLARVSAKISVAGGELMQVRYAESSLQPAKGKKSSSALGSATGPDTRPPPSDDDRRKFGEYVKSRFIGTSEDQRRRIGEIMQEKMKGNEGLSDRQKGELFIKVLDQVAPMQR